MRAGKLRRTGRGLDLAIEGRRLFLGPNPQTSLEPQSTGASITPQGRESYLSTATGILAKRGLNRNWILMPRASSLR